MQEARGKGQETGSEQRVGHVLGHASRILHLAGCDSPQLDVELLLAHVLGWDRARLLAHPERALTAAEWEQFTPLLARRQAREPLAYILGRREFYALDFLVDRRVLVPRPETELLVEHTLDWSRERMGERMGEGGSGVAAHDIREDSSPIRHRHRHPHPLVPSHRPLTIADVGTGSGCVAIALAVHLPRATVYALDSSADGLEVAAANVTLHGVEGQVRLLRGDLLEPLPERVDIFVANLPYVRDDELATLEAEVRDYEPRAALDGGPDGLWQMRRLLAQAAAHLQPGGAIFLEIGAEQGQAARQLARQHFPRASVDVLPDYGGHDRVLHVQT